MSLGGARGLNAMFDAAAQGIARAQQRADGAAQQLAQAGVERAGMEPDKVSVSFAQPAAAPDVVGGLVDLRVARYQQTANLAVLKTADEMSEEVLSI